MRLRCAAGVEVAGMKRLRLDQLVLPNPLMGLQSRGRLRTSCPTGDRRTPCSPFQTPPSRRQTPRETVPWPWELIPQAATCDRSERPRCAAG
ncbi:unnamed protein product [Tetraodon nigroviridis]|uniref:(spotted green pufferfish) hypothetical protein n=1 Tax=Tetraodon nigroviridis TaxID=99883 RepID=Q4RHI0_TETNG|nr:unnamed protein product [Tetraodon nigroviridis]